MFDDPASPVFVPRRAPGRPRFGKLPKIRTSIAIDPLVAQRLRVEFGGISQAFDYIVRQYMRDNPYSPTSAPIKEMV